jgi:predicted Zn finger-like uncharacterized protein
MAYSKCPSCSSTYFETPSGSRYKLQFVKCSSCGTVVGVLDYYNIGALLFALAKKLGFDLES